MSLVHRCFLIACALSLTLDSPSVLLAQGAVSPPGRPALASPGDSASPVTPRASPASHAALLRVASLVAVSAALIPVDPRIARWTQRGTVQRNQALTRSATMLREVGDPGTIIASVGAYGVGRLAGSATLTDIGAHATEAIVVSAIVGGVIKGTSGRLRPFASPGFDADEFRLGRGFRRSDIASSFPSGHTTAAFTLASVLSSESRERWPRAARWVTLASFTTASLVGASRVYNDQHWASDVVLAAAVGTAAGAAVVRRQHAHPSNKIDRILRTGALWPDGRGARLAFSFGF